MPVATLQATTNAHLAHQGDLFSTGPLAVPPTVEGAEREAVGPRSWVEHAPRWLPGADELFGELARAVPWSHNRRVMYDRIVEEPRLVAWYGRGSPLPHPALQELASTLAEAYGRPFDSVGMNLYRNGRDSVAWHGDRVEGRTDAVVALVSLGSPRPFLLRPTGGGPSRSWHLGHGDLFVMGGACQVHCEHAVPKVARAGPRLSMAFRHGSLRERYPTARLR
jgi:alkylated DNA repair dioxygenase AlkB